MSITNNCLNWCYMKADVNQFTYNWPIDNFSERNHQLIKSAPFHAEDSSWTLIVAPVVKNINDGNEYLGVFLNRESGDKPLWTKFTFSVLNSSNEKCNAKTYSCFYHQTINGRNSSHLTGIASNANGGTAGGARQRQTTNPWNPVETIILNPGQIEALRFEYSPPLIHQQNSQRSGDASPSARNSIQLIQGKSSGIKSFIAREFLFDSANSLLVNNKLMICCDIRIFIINDPIEPLERFDTTISNDYSLLLKDHKFTDVKLRVDGVDILAHKAILSARSPVFCAMFEHNMKENNENMVKIDDMSKLVANELFQFIYTGKVTNLGKVAKELLAAADKYQLPQLVSMCEECLMSNLTVDTSPEILVLSHLHKANKLKTVVVDYIIANRKEVMKCDNWLLIRQQTDLMEELFKALSSYFDKTQFGVYCP